MTENFINLVEEKIGYKFSNKKLLLQAFTRKTWSQENGGENNESLEFVGDKALDVVVIIAMLKRFSSIQEDGFFHTKYNEGKFTDIKRDLVEKEALSKSMDKLGLNQYLLMGNGDKLLNIQEKESVKEDLFESIIGAVAIDCNWDSSVLYTVVDKMIGFDDYFSNDELNDFNYIGWVNDYAQKATLFPPLVDNEWDDNLKKYVCSVMITGLKMFKGYGDSKQKAAKDAAKKAYIHIHSILPKANPIIKLVGMPDEFNSISQVNELVQNGIIKLPKEEEIHSYSASGTDCWCIYLYADGKTYNSVCIGRKNDARRKNYYKYLLDLVSKYENQSIM